MTVPGSSANLGPEFDVLGMAVDRYLDVALIDGANTATKAADETHLAVRVFRDAGGSGPNSVRSTIPPARRLGFPGAARVAGTFAAAEIAVALDSKLHARIREHWSAAAVDDDEILELIAQVHESTGRLIDPHTAVALGAARKNPSDRTQVVMATAHPAKNPNAVEQATGRWLDLPPNLGDLFDAEVALLGRAERPQRGRLDHDQSLGATVEPARQEPEGMT